MLNFGLLLLFATPFMLVPEATVFLLSSIAKGMVLLVLSVLTVCSCWFIVEAAWKYHRYNNLDLDLVYKRFRKYCQERDLSAYLVFRDFGYQHIQKVKEKKKTKKLKLIKEEDKV